MVRIATGIDGSPRSLTAFRHAAAFGAGFGNDLVALHVVDPTADETISPGQGRMRAARRAAELERSLTPVLKEHRARFVTVMAERGESPAEALRRGAAEEGAALLALGSRGGSGLQRRTLGGVATDLLRNSSLPLLLTGTNAGEPHTGGPMLWLTDEPVGGAALARSLHGVLAGGAASIVVVHLQPLDLPAPLAELRFTGRIDALRRLAPRDATIEGRFEHVGDRARVLPRVLELATELGASCFALATSGHRLSHRLWGASTALRLLEESPIPLVVVSRR